MYLRTTVVILMGLLVVSAVRSDEPTLQEKRQDISALAAAAKGKTPTEQQSEVVAATVKKAKLFEVHGASTSLDTSRTVVFQGKRGKVEVTPGTAVFVELPRPTKVMVWQAGDAPEGIGDEELPVKFTHVVCWWEKDGSLTFLCAGPEKIPGE